MSWMIWLPAALLLLALGYLFLTLAGRPRLEMKAWRGVRFAHRGLHGPDAAENGLRAFERACEAGYGIELDVQQTLDGVLVVFHDDSLRRVCGVEDLVRQKTLAQLQTLRLNGGPETMPTLDAVLETVASRVPLLVEIKNAPNVEAVTAATVSRLREYQGKYLIESFTPLCLRWLRKNAPDILRGQLAGGYRDYRGQPILQRVILSCQLLNFLGRPDFLAVNEAGRAHLTTRVNRLVRRVPLALWTIRDPQPYEQALIRGEMPIFEGFTPGR